MAGGHSWPQMGSTIYGSMDELVAAYPELGEADRLSLYGEIFLHFVRGFSFILIGDLDEFRRRYLALARHGGAASSNRPSAADFGPFDVTEIAPPLD